MTVVFCGCVWFSVCGLIVPQEDLPFNDLGMCPDVVSDNCCLSIDYCLAVPGACMPNFRGVSLAILELFAFNTPKMCVSCDTGHAQFSKTFSGSCQNCPWGMHVKF